MKSFRALCRHTTALLLWGASTLHAADVVPLAVAEVTHAGPVDFEGEILPILRRNCLACHSVSEAEAELVLETPKTILHGGSQGPAVVPGKATESLLLTLASHRDSPVMPPAGNNRNAQNLTAEELGLLKLWIDQGAKGEVSNASAPIVWQPLPSGLNPIYAVALTPDGRTAAASRANQIFMTSVAARQELGRLTDPALLKSGLYSAPGVAHLDLVYSLAFSPDGERLASGSFRTINIWRRPHDVQTGEFALTDAEMRMLAISPDRKLVAVGEASGAVQLYQTSDGKPLHSLSGHTKELTGVAFSHDGSQVASVALDQTVRVWNAADGRCLSAIASPVQLTAIVFVLNDTQVAAAGADGAIRTWAIPAANSEATPIEIPPTKVIGGHTDRITALVALQPDGIQLLSGSLDGTVRQSNAQTGEGIRSFNDGGPITAIEVRGDGQRLITVGEFGRAKLWDVEKGQPIAEIAPDDASPDNLDELRIAIDTARRHVQTSKADLDVALIARTAEYENYYAAVVDVAKTDIDAKKKAAAAIQPAAEQKKADDALAALKAEASAAEAAKKLLDDPASQATDEARNQNLAALAALKPKLMAAEAEAKSRAAVALRAAEDQATAAQLHESAKLTVTRNRAALDSAESTQLVPQAKALHEARKKEERTALDRLALAERTQAISLATIRDLETRKTNAHRVVQGLEARLLAAPPAAVESTPAAQEAVVAASNLFTAAAAALEAARSSASETAMKTQTLTKLATDDKAAADKATTDSEMANTAATAALDTATKALTAAQTAATQAQDEFAKTLSAAELANAVQKKQIADAVAAQAATVRTEAMAAKDVADKQFAAAQEQAKQQQDAATKAVADADAAYNDAFGKLLAANDAAGGISAQLTTALARKTVADAALAALRKPMRSVALSPNGLQFAIVSSDGRVRIFSTETGEPLDVLTASGELAIAAVYLDNRNVLVGRKGRSLTVWSTLAPWTLERQIGSVDSGDSLIDRVTALSFSPDGKLLGSGGGEASRSGELKIWDVATGGLVREIPNAHSDMILALAFSPDGKYLATGGADRFLKVFESATGTLVKSFEGHTHHVLGVSWRIDGRVLATSGADKLIKLWDFQTGEQARTFPEFAKEATSLEFLGATDTLVCSVGNQVVTRQCDGGSGVNLTGATEYIYSVRSSRTPRVIAGGGQDSMLRIWNQQGQLLMCFPAPVAPLSSQD